MLKIINNLEPFFNDVYIEISVREYSRITKVSPPTASKLLNGLNSENLLKKREFRNLNLFRANLESDIFKDFAKIYWKTRLRAELKILHEKSIYKRMVVFGSISKCENTTKSDIDIFMDSEKREFELTSIKKRLGRDIDLHFREESKNLEKNIRSGLVLFD